MVDDRGPAGAEGLKQERGWLVPASLLTLVSAVFALAMIPDRSGIMPALLILPLWMFAAMVIAAVYSLLALIGAGVKSPIAHIRRFCVEEWRTALLVVAGFLLAGFNMITFMWIKPLLNYLVPFWADPLLADLDRALFLGRDPWSLLTWLNSVPMAVFYHRGWFAMMILTLMMVMAARPSAEKSAILLTYFLLWSVVGPLVHTLVPAAGPVFFDELGHGGRFAGLVGVRETQQVADYLWTLYASEGFGPGSGISAMPSLHIATTAWMMIATLRLSPRWAIPTGLLSLLIFLLSISLGWHYAVDGLVGAAAAFVCWRLSLAGFRGELRRPRAIRAAVQG